MANVKHISCASNTYKPLEFSPDDENHGIYGSLMNCAGDVIGVMGSIPCIICCPNPYKVSANASMRKEKEKL